MIAKDGAAETLAKILYATRIPQHGDIAHGVEEDTDEEFKKEFARAIVLRKLRKLEEMHMPIESRESILPHTDYDVVFNGQLYAVAAHPESIIPGMHKTPLTQHIYSVIHTLSGEQRMYHGAVWCMPFQLNNTAARQNIARAGRAREFSIGLLDLGYSPASLERYVQEAKQRR